MELGVQERCRFLGYRRDMSRWYGIFDAFLLTSENEGTPVVAIEALASGCPVVATDAGGTATVVRHGESGYLAPIGETGALAGYLSNLADDPEQSSLTRAGRLARCQASLCFRNNGGCRRLPLPAAPGPAVKVVHIHKITGISGSERHLLSLLPALRERGVDARFLGLDVPETDAPRFYEELAAVGVPFEQVRCTRRPESADGRRRRQSHPQGSARPPPHSPRARRRLRLDRVAPRERPVRLVAPQRRPLPDGLVPSRRSALRPARTTHHRDLGRSARLPRARRPPRARSS